MLLSHAPEITAQRSPDAIAFEICPSGTGINAGLEVISSIDFTTSTPFIPSALVPFQSIVVVPSWLRPVVKPAP